MPFLDNSTEPSPVLRKMIEKGELGVKSGKGFYEWTDDSARELSQRIACALVSIENWSHESQ